MQLVVAWVGEKASSRDQAGRGCSAYALGVLLKSAPNSGAWALALVQKYRETLGSGYQGPPRRISPTGPNGGPTKVGLRCGILRMVTLTG